MSALSVSLDQVKADIRSAIQAEHNQVKEKLDELLVKITDLEGQIGEPDADVAASIEEAKSIVAEIQGIFEPPATP